MRLFLLVFFFVTSTLTLFPKSKLDSLVAIGNEQSFQFNFKQAGNTFNRIINDFPNSPLGYYFLSRNSLWFYLANKDSASKANYLKYSELAKAKGEKEYDNDKSNPQANYNLGNIYLLESIFNSTEQNTMDAFWAVRSVVNYFEEAIELDENYYEPYLGLGTIKYALGFVPGFLGWAISIAGVDGEKAKGLSYILKAYENSNFAKTEASYHLGKIYTEYNAKFDKADKHLSNLVDNYPMNELFLYQYAILQIDKRNLPKARKYLDKILSSGLPPKFLQTFSLSHFLVGEISFKENNFEQAIEDYTNFIKQTNSIDYTGIANLKIALSFVILRNDLLAKKHFILSRNGNENIAEDSYATERSKEYFDKKFSDNDIKIIIAQNYLESGKYDLALRETNKITEANVDTEMKFNIDVIKIESYQRLNDFEKSMIVLNSYIDLEKFENFQNYSKFLYLKAFQAFNDKNYDIAKKNLQLSLKNINNDDNKLKRLLVNLSSKLSKIKF